MDKSLTGLWLGVTERLEGSGRWLAPLGLRLLLAWEFWEAGMQKLRGENWFASIQDKFPPPLDLVPVGLSWQLATWAELLGAVALLLGLGTRFFAFVLLVLTAVAAVSVHWPADWASLQELWRGYAISDKGFGNFKLPLLFAAMLLPLVFHGAGRLSLDALVAAGNDALPERPLADPVAWALGLAVVGLPALLLVPAAGAVLLALSVLLLVARRLVAA